MNLTLKNGLGFLISVGAVILVILVIADPTLAASGTHGPTRGESDPVSEPVYITVDPETYIDRFDELYLKAGGIYTLSATAQSYSDDSNMSRVVFQQSDANHGGAIWDDIGEDNNTSDTTYSVEWIPDTEHFYLRAISFDIHDDYAISTVFSDFHVDGKGPVAPLTLRANINLMHSPKAQVNGYIYDRIVEGQTSGVDYVVLYVDGEPVTNEGEEVHIPVIDFQFDYDISLEVISGATGDIS